jgi:glycosyltransferase involved in cell wall biosynthesis
MNNSSLLLEIPVPFRKNAAGLYLVELQALNGLRCWSDNFQQLTVCAPVIPEQYTSDTSMQWVDPSSLLSERNIKFEPLPWGYHPLDYLKHRNSVKKKLTSLINSHNYLCFSNLGDFGAWGNIAAGIARQLNRDYSLWFDWVIHDMPQPKSKSVVKQLRQYFSRRNSKYQTYKAIKGCSLGLFHGKTVYDAYSPICREPHVVHDIHMGKHDAISDDALDIKIASIKTRTDLRIGYIGRVHPMKAPDEWVEVIKQVKQNLGANRIQATWLGNGPQLDTVLEQVKNEGLTNVIELAGFVSDRESIRTFLQQIDVFLFCHVTPESPRCLIEALISGTPIIGYESAYARDLVGDRGGALFSDIHDTKTLADQLCNLIERRDALSLLVKAAATSRSLYNDQAVFEHRSHLIKTHCQLPKRSHTSTNQ